MIFESATSSADLRSHCGAPWMGVMEVRKAPLLRGGWWNLIEFRGHLFDHFLEF